MGSITIPYPGLRPFEEEDHPIFFGREAQINSTLHQLEDEPFIAVIGSSGSGKSSFVRAGLVPAVREGFLLGTTNWLILIVRPGHHPYERLARALNSPCRPESETSNSSASANDASQEQIHTLATLRKTDRGLISALDQSQVSSDTRVMVVVDQFEELFAFRRPSASGDLVASRDEAAAFIRMLLRCSADLQTRIRLVLTMRSDFIGDCEAFLGLPEAISRSQLLVPRLDRAQMEEVIVRPATVQGLAFHPFTFEDGLVSRIINDAGDRSDQLPLMQHALMRTWKLAAERAAGAGSELVRVEHRDYVDAGGFERALSLHAEAAWAEIREDPKQSRIARRLFLLLCDVSPDGQITRRRPRVREVQAVADATVEEIGKVMRAFQADDRNFLLPPPDHPLTPETLLDISHESLIRQWKRFNDWVAEESASAAMLHRLRDAAMRWPEQEPLLRDPALTIALDWQTKQRPSTAWAERYGGGLDRLLEYLHKSNEERQRESEAADAARRTELDEARKRARDHAANARRFRNVALAMLILSCVAVGTAVYAVRQRYEVTSLSRSVEEAQRDKAKLAADIGRLGKERMDSEDAKRELDKRVEVLRTELRHEQTALETAKKVLAGEIKSLRSGHLSLESKQQQLRDVNEALAAIAGALGTVRRQGDGSSAVAFFESDDSPEKALNLLGRIDNVQALNLSRTRITDGGLAEIEQLAGLRSLDLSFTKITDEGIATIAKMPQLTTLLLNDTMITEASLPLLEKLINLKTLNLSHNRINAAAVTQLREKLNGASIIYHPDPLLDALSEHHGNWDQALEKVNGTRRSETRIHFHQSSITDSAIKILGDYSDITFSYCSRITNEGLRELARQKTLESLVLGNVSQVSDEGIERLSQSRSLVSLKLDTIAVTDRTLVALAKMSSLTSLTIGGPSGQLTDEGIANLKRLPNLKQLTLEFHWDLTEASMQSILAMPSLQSITLRSAPGIAASSYAALSQLSDLRELNVSYNDHLTDAASEHLAKLTQLRQLDLTATGFSKQGIERLKKAMPNTRITAEFLMSQLERGSKEDTEPEIDVPTEPRGGDKW